MFSKIMISLEICGLEEETWAIQKFRKKQKQYEHMKAHALKKR
jgi:hypothetical protein